MSSKKDNVKGDSGDMLVVVLFNCSKDGDKEVRCDSEWHQAITRRTRDDCERRTTTKRP